MSDWREEQIAKAKEVGEIHLDRALTIAVPIMNTTEIRSWFEERLKEADEAYQDFLSRPGS